MLTVRLTNFGLPNIWIYSLASEIIVHVLWKIRAYQIQGCALDLQLIIGISKKAISSFPYWNTIDYLFKWKSEFIISLVSEKDATQRR